MIWLVLILMFLPFAVVILFGAPYLPTMKKQAGEALDLLNLKKGELFVDLGCGDGLMLKEAAKRGLIVHGYELNPFLYIVSMLRTIRYRKQVYVHLGDFWKQKLPGGSKGVYVFLLDRYMIKLDEKLLKEAPGAKLLSYTFKVPGKKPLKTKDALNLYQY